MMGSPLTADVLDGLVTVLGQAAGDAASGTTSDIARTATARRVLAWVGDPMKDALPLRLTGGLNALARAGSDAALSAAYAGGMADWPALLHRVLVEYDAPLQAWLDSPPQTNEVGRSGILWPALMVVTKCFGPRVELLELGASGGLNLNMNHFGYNLHGALAGDAASPVQIIPQWTGPAPDVAPVDVVARAGVDLQPLDMTDDAVAAHMLAYIWPDQTQRVANAEAAIAIANAYPPPVAQGDGVAWLAEQLARPQEKGVTRIIYHSVALVYFPETAQAEVTSLIEAAGTRADADHPLAWISFEHLNMGLPDLTLRMWPGDGDAAGGQKAGAPVKLATAHPHGTKVEWFGMAGVREG